MSGCDIYKSQSFSQWLLPLTVIDHSQMNSALHPHRRNQGPFLRVALPCGQLCQHQILRHSRPILQRALLPQPNRGGGHTFIKNVEINAES